jgi:tetratricopeptide (TPR) repeat protein
MTERDRAKFALEEARALLLLSRKKQAAKVAATALELIEYVDPQDRGRCYIALGDVFQTVGEQQTARVLYEKGFDLLSELGAPYVVTAARRLAELLEKEGDTRAALAVFKKATAIGEQSLRTRT